MTKRNTKIHLNIGIFYIEHAKNGDIIILVKFE